MLELSHPDISSSILPVRNQMVWLWLPYPQREGQKGTFLAWKRSRLEVNYQQRQILLSFSWVRKIKATLIPALSPQPSNSWECCQLICLSFVVFPSLALEIKDTSSTPSGEKPGASTMCPPRGKSVASFPALPKRPQAFIPQSQQILQWLQLCLFQPRFGRG